MHCASRRRFNKHLPTAAQILAEIGCSTWLTFSLPHTVLPPGVCASTSTCPQPRHWALSLPPMAATAARCTWGTWTLLRSRWGECGWLGVVGNRCWESAFARPGQLHLGHLNAASEQVGQGWLHLGVAAVITQADKRRCCSAASFPTTDFLAVCASQRVGWGLSIQQKCCCCRRAALARPVCPFFWQSDDIPYFLACRRGASVKLTLRPCCNSWRPACSSSCSTSVESRWAGGCLFMFYGAL